MGLFHRQWPVFFEDNHLLVLYKPAGLLIQRDHKNKACLLDLAKAWIKVRYAKPGRVFIGMVHRLDAPVAGVVVLARTSKAAGRLSGQFREGRVEKEYLAVVNGRPPQPSSRLVHHLVRDGRISRPVSAPSPGSREAALRYRILEARDRSSLLSIFLETGRRHQIRAQLAQIKCPIFGDRAYGAPQTLPHGRIALMAYRLVITHPTLARPVVSRCPTPLGWPWETAEADADAPLWGIEDYLSQGFSWPAVLP
jgi:23S rRNA pseudouridine1911/1915/1917 synthase